MATNKPGETFGSVGNNPGDDFINNAITPTSTTITLLAGVPLDSDQNDQLWFESKSAQEAYFNSISDRKVITQNSYAYKDQQLRINLNVEQCWKYNYVMYKNVDYGDKWFYAFITSMQYRTQHSCFMTIKTDIFQTWLFDVKFQQSYVKRMQLPEFRQSSVGVQVPYQRNDDENLNYGDEYDIKAIIQITPEKPQIKWLLLISSESLEVKDEPDIGGTTDDPNLKYQGFVANGVPTSLHFYLLPFTISDLSTTECNGHQLADLRAIFKYLAVDKKLSGKVVSANVMDWCPIPIRGNYKDGYSTTKANNGTLLTAEVVPIGTFDKKDPLSPTTGTATSYVNVIRANSWNRTSGYSYTLGDAYKYFDRDAYSKLMTSPYAIIEMTDAKGHQQIIKPEYVHGGKLEVQVSTSLSWTPKIAYTVKHYNISADNVEQIETDQGNHVQSWDTSIYDTNPGDLPIITSQLASFMQAQKNSLAAAQTNQNLSILGGAINTGIQGAGAGAMGGGIGALAGAGLGLATGAVNGVISKATLTNTQNAKIKDIDNMPPNISGMGQNPIFDANNNICGCYLIFKQLKQEYQQKLHDYFHMYGYKYNRLVDLGNFKNAFHSRQHWNYIETQGISIVGHINNQDMAELQHIFDTGVTLWHDLEPGDYTETNPEV